MELILSIKEIRQAEMAADDVISLRETGDFSKEFRKNNQIFDIVVLKNKSVFKMTTEELSEMGEFISKAQELIALMSGKDRDLSILKRIVRDCDRPFARPLRNALKDSDFNSRKDAENKKIEAYAFMLGLNVHTAHQVLTNYTKKCDTVFNRKKLVNFTDIVFAGMTPDEIQIMFGLSSEEKQMLVRFLYTEIEDAIKETPEFTEWKNAFVERSAEMLDILNKRMAGNTEDHVCYAEQNYIMQVPPFGLSCPSANGKDLAEISVKILFFTEMYKNFSVDYIKELMKKVVNSESGFAEQAIIEELLLSEDEFMEEIRENLKKDNTAFFSQVQDRLLAPLCLIDEKTAMFIKKHFIGKEDYVKTFTLKDLAYICLFMRTDIATECIRHIFGMDNEVTRSFTRLFKNRI